MEFNKVIRGAKREVNTQKYVYDIIDAGFLCHVGFQHEGSTMMIPTAYGRLNDAIHLHGSTKNFMLNQLLNGQVACISIAHLDGIVLAKTLFHTSVNYRSVVLFGKAILVDDENERLLGLKTITENIVRGRWNEVKLGEENELRATMVIRFNIDNASAKVRAEGPAGDEMITDKIWSGHIPLRMQALTPVTDTKFGDVPDYSPSVRNYFEKNR